MIKQKTIYTLYDTKYLIDPDSAMPYSSCNSLEEAQEIKRETFNNAIIVKEVVEIEDNDTKVISKDIVDDEISSTILLDHDDDSENYDDNADDDNDDDLSF